MIVAGRKSGSFGGTTEARAIVGAAGSKRAHMYVPRAGLLDDGQPKRTMTSFFGDRSVSALEPAPDVTADGPSVPQTTTVCDGDDDLATLVLAAGVGGAGAGVGVAVEL